MEHVSDETKARVGELLKKSLEDAREQLANENADGHDAAMFTRALDSLLAWDNAEARLARHAEALRCDAEERVEQCKGAARVLSALEQKRMRWCQYASSALSSMKVDPTVAAGLADTMLELEEERFGP